jgi:prephenate dehydratase
VLHSDISALPNNHTRFVVLGKKDSPKTRNDKTSIVFSIRKDKPGGLYGVLGEFAQREINLTKIESRPAKTTLGDYYFFIDFQGHRDDEDVAEVLRAIRRKASMLKILGSYPRSAG